MAGKGEDVSSVKDQLAVLIVDKLVLGAIIAVAFLVYDGLKTKELRTYAEAEAQESRTYAEIQGNESRRYAEAQREIDRDLLRADYVKELVPFVLDSARDPFFRTQALAELVGTGSISPESAVRFTERLLQDDILAVGSSQVTNLHPLSWEYGARPGKTFYPGSEEEFLLSTLVRTMPDGIPWVLSEYRRLVLQLETMWRDSPKGYEEDPLYGARNNAARFWTRLFYRTVAELTDAELGVLDGGSFLAENLRALFEFTPQDWRYGRSRLDVQHAPDVARWFDRENTGLRILGAVALLASDETHQGAIEYVGSVVNPGRTVRRLGLASAVVDLLAWRNVDPPELVEEAANLLLSGRTFFLESEGSDVAEAGQRLVGEVEDYLYWAVRVSAVTAVVEPMAVEELRTFLEGIRRRTAEPYGDDGCYPVESGLVRVLSATNANDTGSESEEARALLRELDAALPEAVQRRCFRDSF